MWQMGVNGCGRSKERARLLGAINKLLDGYVFKQNGEIPQQRPRRAAGPRRILYPFDDAACWQEAPGRRVGVAVGGRLTRLARLLRMGATSSSPFTWLRLYISMTSPWLFYSFTFPFSFSFSQHSSQLTIGVSCNVFTWGHLFCSVHLLRRLHNLCLRMSSVAYAWKCSSFGGAEESPKAVAPG